MAGTSKEKKDRHVTAPAFRPSAGDLHDALLPADFMSTG